ncbi:GntR family transcriptional regulator [Mycolicibacterium nivoides]|uniref:GntR family transcriptional regulator n=1 Tax=Mycolicibacterium nivoides TaxID=2487344 RepID=UPI003C2EE557
MPTRKGSGPVGGDRKLRYQQVQELVLSIMTERDLRPGDRLPSTTELAEIADVSTISVRRALDELERAGRIHRHQGLGTFVAEPRIGADPTRPGELLQTLTDNQGRSPSVTTALIAMSVGLPSATIAAALGVDEGQPTWEIWRRRTIGQGAGADRILERAVLPLSRVPSIDRDQLAAGESLYRFLQERYGLTDEYTEQAFEVDTPNSWESDQLELDPGELVVRIRGVSFDSTGQAFDCFEQCYRATKFTFYTAGQTRHRILGPSELSNWSVSPLTDPQRGSD